MKDAASAAVYGARAANGVVLVTTKGGSKGKKLLLAMTSHTVGKILGEREMFLMLLSTNVDE